MDSDKAQELADILDIDVEHAKDFINSLTVSELASVNTNLENGNFNDIKSFFTEYTDQYGEETDLDKEYSVRQYYQELLDKGYDKDIAASKTEKELEINKEDLDSILHGSVSQYTNEHDQGINTVLEKIELMKRGAKLEGQLIKGLNTEQIKQVMDKSLESIRETIGITMSLTPKQVRTLYSKSQGFKHNSVLESTMSLSSMRDKLIESELCKLFEAMKNKWKKRSYWRKRPNNQGLGTVGVDGFDFYDILDPHNEIESDDFGVIKVDLENVNTLKKYIVDNAKNKK